MHLLFHCCDRFDKRRKQNLYGQSPVKGDCHADTLRRRELLPRCLSRFSFLRFVQSNVSFSDICRIIIAQGVSGCFLHNQLTFSSCSSIVALAESGKRHA